MILYLSNVEELSTYLTIQRKCIELKNNRKEQTINTKLIKDEIDQN